MSVSINKVMLGGNLTKDPEVRFLSNEQAVAKFDLAINRRFKDKDGNPREEVTFVSCEAWGRTAELVGQYLVKGRSCFVEGRLKLDLWDDKDGQKRQKMKVVADSVQFLDSGNRTDLPAPSGDAESPEPKPRRPAPVASNDDEPPF